MSRSQEYSERMAKLYFFAHGHDHFRCPMCIKLYQPWSSKAGSAKFNKAVVLSDPSDGELQILPAWWPADAETKFVNMLKEYTAARRDGGFTTTATLENVIEKVNDILKDRRTLHPVMTAFQVPDPTLQVASLSTTPPTRGLGFQVILGFPA